MSPLQLSVLEIEKRPRRFRLSTDDRWWDEHRAEFRDAESRQTRPFVLDLEAYRLGKRLLFRGRLSGAIELPCGRCLDPYEHALEEPLELLLEPMSNPDTRAEGTPEGGIEFDAEELELGRYAGDELDFGVVLREILLFDWPLQPLCRDDCAGLCESCGVNLNSEACCCERTGARPFAALGQMLERARSKSD